MSSISDPLESDTTVRIGAAALRVRYSSMVSRRITGSLESIYQCRPRMLKLADGESQTSCSSNNERRGASTDAKNKSNIKSLKIRPRGPRKTEEWAKFDHSYRPLRRGCNERRTFASKTSHGFPEEIGRSIRRWKTSIAPWRKRGRRRPRAPEIYMSEMEYAKFSRRSLWCTKGVKKW